MFLDHEGRGLVASRGEGEQREDQEGEKAERRDAQGARIRLEANLGGLSDKSGERKAGNSVKFWLALALRLYPSSY